MPHPTTQPADATHHLVPGPAGRIHLVEQGSGPLVLLVHGFPESWYSWRHQLPVLAAAGYRAVAVDVRGYGRSSRPDAVEAYRMRDLVADNVAVVEALGERSAVVVGHDWGATIAAHSALLSPDVFRAVGLLSVPYTPPGGPRPTEVFAQLGGGRSHCPRPERPRSPAPWRPSTPALILFPAWPPKASVRVRRVTHEEPRDARSSERALTS
jgi:pimeloyl-ACP methyl ester carboxylesterase